MLIASAIFTAIIVNYSLRHGRLILFPTYDDVGYLEDAATHIQTLYYFGPWAMLVALANNPPHSPFATALAITGFLIAGVRDWAPYAANVVIVIATLLFTNKLCRHLRLPQRLAIFALILSTPMLGMAVHEFRPDFMVSLLISIGAILLIGRPFVHSRPSHWLAGGCAFAAAMLAKPSAFPATILYFGASLILATLADRFGGKRFSFLQLLRAWTWTLGPFVLLPAPYYILAGRRTWNYFVGVLFGEYRDVWELKASLSTHIRYYLDGAGGAAMLGSHLYIFAVLIAIGLLVQFARRHKPHLVRAAALALLLLSAYLLVTFNQTKQMFFGLTFHILLMYLAVLNLRDLLIYLHTHAPRRGGWVAGLLLIGVVIWGAFGFNWPGRYGDFSSDWMLNRREIVYGVFDSIHDRVGDQPAKILLTTTGDINPDLMLYESQKRLARMAFFRVSDSNTNLADRVTELDRADYAVASEPGSTLVADFLPGNRLEGPILEVLQHRHDYKQVARFEFRKKGKSFFVFQRVGPFSGYEILGGLGAPEGPYPQWNLPDVRWGLKEPATVLRLTSLSGGAGTLHISGRTPIAGQTIVLRLNADEVARFHFTNVDEFEDFSLPITIGPGRHTITLAYTKAEEGPVKRAVLFREIHFDLKATNQ